MMEILPEDSSSPALYDADAFRAAGFSCPDVYFTPGYGEAETSHGAGEWASVVAYGGRWQLPIHLRSAGDVDDALTPYGYSGVYASPELSPAQGKEAWERTCELLRERGLISLFVRQSSLVTQPFQAPPGRSMVSGHQTVLVKTADAGEAWSGMQGRSRTSIRKADRDGYVSSLRPAISEDLEHGSPFRSLYEGAMRRRGASARYFFTDGYYEALLRGLGDSLLVGLTHGSDGQPACAALFLRHGEFLHYHLSGSNSDAGRAGATNQLIWSAIQWAAARGVLALHLGGGVEPGDSLLKFKQSFGGDLLSFVAYGVVLDIPGYERAVRRRAHAIGVTEEELKNSSFFPAYRRSA